MVGGLHTYQYLTSRVGFVRIQAAVYKERRLLTKSNAPIPLLSAA